jgi:hypothetical protein
MTPVLKAGLFVFCVTPDETLAGRVMAHALSYFREDEGIALILPLEQAAALGFDTAMPMRRIVLEVFSALDGVGLTAAVSSALAEAGISCNMVAAFHHDNVFVPAADAERALAILRAVQEAASG